MPRPTNMDDIANGRAISSVGSSLPPRLFKPPTPLVICPDSPHPYFKSTSFPSDLLHNLITSTSFVDLDCSPGQLKLSRLPYPKPVNSLPFIDKYLLDPNNMLLRTYVVSLILLLPVYSWMFPYLRARMFELRAARLEMAAAHLRGIGDWLQGPVADCPACTPTPCPPPAGCISQAQAGFGSQTCAGKLPPAYRVTGTFASYCDI